MTTPKQLGKASYELPPEPAYVAVTFPFDPLVPENDRHGVREVDSSRKVQQEFPQLKKRFWGRHFWARGYFSATSGNVTDDVIDAYISNHYDAHKQHDEENISL